MKTFTRNLAQLVSDNRKVRVAFFIFTVAMFILSAGAPDATGGIGMH
jgi:hypothetical protein